jgi:hypothetical protein
MPDDPKPDETDERIARLEKELKDQVRTIFTDAPDPGPIPEVLRKGPPTPHEPEKLNTDTAGMAKAWAVALDSSSRSLPGPGLGGS